MPQDAGGLEGTPELAVVQEYTLRRGGLDLGNLGEGEWQTEGRSSVTLRRGRSSMKLRDN